MSQHIQISIEAGDNFSSYEVNEALKAYDTITQTIPHQNWNEVWESNFQPVVVENFCAVRAPFHEPVQDVVHEMVIMPKMSFGTGHHATTWMMMAQMQHIDFAGKKVFDFGTGTGILAILAEKLGAERVVAIDNDEWSIENGKENAERNGCSKIGLYFASSVPDQQFDIVLANINRNVILMHLQYLVPAIIPQGLILFSGLLADDEEDIVTACSGEGLQLLRQQSRNNWISLLFQRM
jgi:ribosomal protein L11 methyltransferase